MNISLRTMAAMRVAVIVLLLLTGAAIPAVYWTAGNAAADPDHAALRDFIVALGPLTRPGDRVALIVPPDFRDQDTLAYRARYLLPGRHVILDPRGADVIAFWRVPAPRNARAMKLGEGAVVR